MAVRVAATLFAVALMLACGPGSARPSVAWVSWFSHRWINDAAVTRDGGLVVVGQSSSTEDVEGISFGQTSYRPFVARLDADGEVLWSAVGFQGGLDHVAVDLEGTIYAVGNEGDHPYRDNPCVVIAFGAAGERRWTRARDDCARDVFHSTTAGLVLDLGSTLEGLDSYGVSRWTIADPFASMFATSEVGEVYGLLAHHALAWGRLGFAGRVTDVAALHLDEADPDDVHASHIARGEVVAVHVEDVLHDEGVLHVFDRAGRPRLRRRAPRWGPRPLRASILVGDGSLLLVGEVPEEIEIGAPAKLWWERITAEGTPAGAGELHFAEDREAAADAIGCPACDTGPGEVYGSHAPALLASPDGNAFLIGRQHCRHSFVAHLGFP